MLKSEPKTKEHRLSTRTDPDQKGLLVRAAAPAI